MDTASDRAVPDARRVPQPSGPDRARAALGVTGRGFATLAIVTLAAGTVLVGPVLDAPPGSVDLETLDVGLSRWLADRRTDELDTATALASRLGDTEPVVAVAMVVAAVGLLRRIDWRPLLLVLSGLTVELLVFLTASYSVARDRPPVERLGSTPSTSSFPSGHAAAAVVLWVAIALLATWPGSTRRWRPGAVAAAAVVAVAIGLARLYRGMHHATDILAGWALGAASLAVALVVVEAALRGSSAVRSRKWIRLEPAATDPRAGPDAC